jgi:hypothetical protein
MHLWNNINRATSMSKLNGVPDGYNPHYSWLPIITAGRVGLSEGGGGSGTLTIAIGKDLAGGKYAQATITNAAVVSNANLNGIGKILSTINGLSQFTSDIMGIRFGIATLIGTGSISTANINVYLFAGATLGGIASVSPDLIGARWGTATLAGLSQIEATIAAYGNITSTITAHGEIISGNLAGVLNAIAALSGTGLLSPPVIIASLNAAATIACTGQIGTAQIIGLVPLFATLAGLGRITSHLSAGKYIEALLSGQAEIEGTLDADAWLEANISVSGGLTTWPTADQNAAAVWSALASQYDARGSFGKLLSAVGGGADPETIAQAVLDVLLSETPVAGSLGEILQNLRDEAFGRWAVDLTENTLTMYKTDGSVLKVFDLTSTADTVPIFIGRTPQ